MTISVADIKTVEQLEEWVKYRGARFGIFERYQSMMETCRALVAVQYPGKKFDWPAPTLQPCMLDINGHKHGAFVHWYHFPDGFKTGVILVMGHGELDRYITSITFVDKHNYFQPLKKEDTP